MFHVSLVKSAFRVFAMSGMDLFVIIFIGKKQLDFVIGSSVLGVVGILILPLAILQ